MPAVDKSAAAEVQRRTDEQRPRRWRGSHLFVWAAHARLCMSQQLPVETGHLRQYVAIWRGVCGCPSAVRRVPAMEALRIFILPPLLYI